MFNQTTNRRKLLKTLAAAGLLGGSGLIGLIRQALAAGNSPVAPGFRRIKGNVTLNGQPAREGLLVKSGDKVTTGKDAEAIYVIGQDAFLQRESTQVSFGDGLSAATTGLLRVVTGKLLSVFGRGEKRIIAPTASIGIRGTACYIEAEAERVYFCLCYGVADLVPTKAPQERETIVATHHERPLYIYSDMKMPKMLAPASVINHTDVELTMLEALVGRKPPFGGLGYRY